MVVRGNGDGGWWQLRLGSADGGGVEWNEMG